MSVHAEPPPPIVSEPHGISYATANQLGKGGFAICFKAERLDKDRPTGHVVALKIVKTKMEPAKLAQKFVTELQIHSKLCHPNVVAFHRAFSFGESTYVVLELCSSGSLADMLKKRKNLTMPEIRRFIIQVSGAVKYLHTRNIVHRDLKTGNLFLDEQMNIKVGDFGLAALLVSGKDMDAKRRTTMCGTPNYLAPEILEKGKGHNEKVDLWAIGIIAYTLAVGKAPFHASSKDEIYKKLRAGDYSWPELSSITNDISADLRDLVSSLLVTEELRPSPDQIVSHAFFKIAFVPRKMSRSQLTRTPIWPTPAIPTPEVLERGYSDSWWYVCKESGVGEYTPGKFFQLNSGKRIRSVVRDIEREVAAGRQPVLPIPHDTVYTTFPYSSTWASQISNGLEEITEEKETSLEGRQLKDISNNEVLHPLHVRPRDSSAEAENRKKKDAELMPPPSQTARRPVAAVRKMRTVTGVPTRASRIKPAEIEDLTQPSSSQPRSSQIPSHSQIPSSTPVESVDNVVANKGSVDASLARRPRAMRNKSSSRDLPASEAATVNPEKAQTQNPPPVRNVVRSRAKPAAAEVIEIFDDAVESQRDPPSSAQPTSMPRSLSIQRSSATPKSPFPGTSPETVLERMCIFRDNLASCIEKKQLAPSRRTVQNQSTRELPFVSRWVDYSRKHGVGYVLEDGTVGYIANGSAAKGTPVTHVVVRNGERWLRRVGRKFEAVEKVPFQILEDCGADGIRSMSPAAQNGSERERVRMMKVLWVKFGRYMSPGAVSGEDGDVEEIEEEVNDTNTDLLFVRFYQRLGNVGIWGFSDGCIQIHFPDHTKFVFSADGLHTSATLVPVEGTMAIQQNNELPPKLLRERKIMTHPVHALLYGSQPGRGQKSFADVVNANMFEQKLEFLLSVMDQWVEGGGLGCTRGRTGTGESDRLQWQGLWVKEHARKMDWVTVGKLGGDEV